MIRINLLAEKKAVKGPKAAISFNLGSGMQSVLLAAIMLLALAFIGWQWISLQRENTYWEGENRKADAELVRLEEVRRKGDDYKKQKDLLERKVNLITELKRKQAVPVHILDQVSRNLPDFLWLDSMSGNGDRLSIRGKATNYNAVANFYNNLAASPWFANVTQGAISEAAEGVTFSLTCDFVPQKDDAAGTQG